MVISNQLITPVDVKQTSSSTFEVKDPICNQLEMEPKYH